jgi:hypothetical protein
MLAVPFFRSIYFNSSFFIFHSSFPLWGTRPNEWGFLDAYALRRMWDTYILSPADLDTAFVSV